jgi:hypothetical protein
MSVWLMTLVLGHHTVSKTLAWMLEHLKLMSLPVAGPQMAYATLGKDAIELPSYLTFDLLT